MIKGKQNILEHYDANSHKFVYWVIFPYNNRTNRIAQSPDVDSLAPSAARDQLQATLNRLEAGTRYTIAFKESPKDAKGYIETVFENDGTPGAGSSNIAGIGALMPAVDVEVLAEKKANELFEKFRTQLTLDEQAKTIKELQKQLRENQISPIEQRIADVMGKFPAQTAQMMAGIGSLFSGQQTAVGINGFAPQSNAKSLNEISGNDEDKLLSELNTALEQWKEADQDFLLVIKKIAHVAATKPEAYNTYKPMILNM